MEEKINALGNQSIRYVVNKLAERESDQKVGELPNLDVPAKTINYKLLKQQLILLATYSEKYRRQILELIDESESVAEEGLIVATDPVTGVVVVALSSIYFTYKLLDKALDNQSKDTIPNYPNSFSRLFRKLPPEEEYYNFIARNVGYTKRKTGNLCRILIFVVEDIELKAILRQLEDWIKKEDDSGAIYYMANYRGVSIGVRQVLDQGNTIMATEVTDFGRMLEPEFIFLTGIAGGVREQKVKLGDVVVANRVCTYESGKQTEKEFRFRNKGGRYNIELIELAKHLSIRGDWKSNLIFPEGRIPEVVIKPIVSGEKVVITDKGQVAAQIKKHCEDAVAIEMEGYGLSAAATRLRHVKMANIRGISDMLADNNKDKTYRDGHREHAARMASIFLFHLIDYILTSK